ncbi:hypothetical protein EJ02DRAFT_121526 [Clathrospora elynae]|uniref:Uncharacterized protein n=1 Tax=Clathrospora elynae TaxID=706981 RepID=A0A6A5T3X8_9PLEO|nr:hypothetical protein EJ02DRAFT_121526 [Clathrospora elynae]
MATAYYFAAHFNTPQPHATDIPSQPPSLSALPSIKEKSPTYNLFAAAAHHHRVPRPGSTCNQESSIFFRIPAELRNQIYEELLCAGTPCSKELAQHPEWSYKAGDVYPAILETCRKIHDEASGLLYSTHIFHAHPSLLTSLPHLLSPGKPIINPAAVANIKRWQLTLRLDTDPRFTLEQATAAFSGVEYLEIRVWQSMFDGCDSSVLRLFTGVRGVKVAKVSGSVDQELARWLEGRMMMPIEENIEEEYCQCENKREVTCGQCCKKVHGGVGSEWFGGSGRDAWTFGNR